MSISLSFLCLVARFLILDNIDLYEVCVMTPPNPPCWAASTFTRDRRLSSGSHSLTSSSFCRSAYLRTSTDSQTCHGPPAHSCHSSSQHYPLPPSKYSGRLWRDRCWYIPYSIVLPKPDGLLFDHEVCLKTNTSCTTFNCIYLKYAVNFIKPCLCLVGLTKRGKTFSYS